MPEPDSQPFLCGLKPVRELLASDPAAIDTIYIRRGLRNDLLEAARAGGVRFHLTDAQALSRLAGDANHQGVVARLLAARTADWTDMLSHIGNAPLPLIVMADRIVDPGNLGTVVRTLYALGGAGLAVPKDNSAYLGPGARRAAAGALERLPVARVVNLARALDEAKDAGLAVYGAAYAPGQSTDIYGTRLALPAVLVLGGEETGIRPNVAKRCDALIHIPMKRNFDSLNVAQAGAICIAECARRHSMEQL